jgi:hypothetical protein
LRKFLGVLGGIVIAVAIQSAIAYATSIAFPQPGIDVFDQRQVAQSFAARETGALILYVASYFVAALVGAISSRIIGRSNALAWVPAGVMAAMALVIALVYPDPAWAQFGAFVAALLGGFVGRHWPARAAAVPATEAATPPDA